MSENVTTLYVCNEISAIQPEESDHLLITFASFEERCLGVINKLTNYSSQKSCILKISDEPSEEREKNFKLMKDKLSSISDLEIIKTKHSDPFTGISKLNSLLSSMKLYGHKSRITIDISTFTKKQLLLILKLLDSYQLVRYTRILYTEPKTYATQLNQPLSYGIKKIGVIPTFRANYDPQKRLILIVFLGYEGDRALALRENIEPHQTIAVLPFPPFHKEWRGTTENMNAALLSSLKSDEIFHADSRNPYDSFNLLKSLIPERDNFEALNWYIAPLGTKLQTVGMYYFCSKYPQLVNVVYAAPISHNETYYSQGIGNTFVVPNMSTIQQLDMDYENSLSELK